jgi:predicted DNA binding CopG/RHH family protein
MRYSISDAGFHEKSLLQEIKKVSRLPKRIRKSLQKEAQEWDTKIPAEGPEKVEKLLASAKPFKVMRPPRQPVSLRLDPFDISMIKRIARKKGIPHTQLMALWLHEKVDQEKEGTFSP